MTKVKRNLETDVKNLETVDIEECTNFEVDRKEFRKICISLRNVKAVSGFLLVRFLYIN